MDLTHRKQLIVAVAYGGLLVSAVLIDLWFFRMPIAGYVLDPFILVIFTVVYIVRTRKVSSLIRTLAFGRGSIFWVIPLSVFLAGFVNDSYLMNQARDWGRDLRAINQSTGAYPRQNETKNLFGYKLMYFSNDSRTSPTIVFEKFDQYRQGYDVAKDMFATARDAS
jgi:hypothetical protein